MVASQQPSDFESDSGVSFMNLALNWLKFLSAAVVLALVVGCGGGGDETLAATSVPEPTGEVAPTPDAVATRNGRDFVVIATDAPNPNFTAFDKFGNVIGFNNDLMSRLSAVADFEFEFVVTPHEGVLENLDSQANYDFDAVMSSLVIPDEPRAGIAYTLPYLEAGQVLMVLADNSVVQSVRDIQPGMAIGVVENSSGEQAALEIARVSESDLHRFDSVIPLLQALIDDELTAVVVESYVAEHFANAYPQQLKIAGGSDRSNWISQKGYGIAVAASNTKLLEQLNQAIVQVQNDSTVERLTVAWLIPSGTINAGESRVPTSASELIIGMVGTLDSMDPASDPDLMGWELKQNTMSGLFAIDSSNALVPMLAAGLPEISADKLEYTIRLRSGIRFPDGSELTADDVKWSIDRSAGLGSFLVNNYLKDSDENNFADDDAVQVVDAQTVKIVLKEPTAYFLDLLATPPYAPISDECYNLSWDLSSSCGGIGPYTIASRDAEMIQLKANPEWPGRPVPAFENIQIRFFTDPEMMLRALAGFQSIDVAWTGLTFEDLTARRDTDIDGDGTPDVKVWTGPAIFKSYLMFDHAAPPWDNENVRQAAALAVDRDALTEAVFNGSRKPLFSPIPDEVPGHLATLPARDLERARTLLLDEGYSGSNPLPITIWYTNDAHYTVLEEAYADAIKSQLEETGVFQVSLQSAPWDIYRPQVGQCGYPAYLLGWPTPGDPVNYLDASSWTDFFILNPTTGFCSNYENEAMAALIESSRSELDPAARTAIIAEIQQLWAAELPTLDLTQETRQALALSKVDNVRIDAMGFLHYEMLTKDGG